MSVVNLTVCDFLDSFLAGIVPSKEILSAFLDATKENDIDSENESLIPTKLLKIMNVIRDTATDDFTSSKEFEKLMASTLSEISVHVHPIKVDFFTGYFKASKIFNNKDITASEKIKALESVPVPSGNAYFDSEYYSRLIALYLGEPVKHIEKIRAIKPLLSKAIEARNNISAEFLG
jgi:hypothetical protein